MRYQYGFLFFFKKKISFNQERNFNHLDPKSNIRTPTQAYTLCLQGEFLTLTRL